eukprot:CAMPEP_0119014614 /NCGR_PEP_ID=MMETSP1176-20130426/10051_1 /TAXON_ID=265551 /ORGANISM="Synedropsis recta cf, Strain CCMP1620" /LENGTH=241 /DNA_ID=CAMNT_0006967817 /DNA_START=41 /DNA_END=766 /DNA_ORIENTATION=+
MSSESTFERLTNNILKSADQIANRIEEGFAILSTGKLPGEEGSHQAEQSGDGDPLADDDQIMMEMDEDMIGSPLEGIADSVLSDLMANQSGPQTPMEHFDAFRSAITWKEPFIMYLIAFQVITFAFCLWVSRRGGGMVPRLVVMITIGILVRCAELINGYGARNWESFATQNYFDKSGIFTGLMLCAPLLMDCFIMLTLLIREASNLLIQVKRMEIKKSREKKNSEKTRCKKSKAKTKKED